MRVQLMLTCLCDSFYGDVGIAAVKILRRAGCEVVFPENQTCCGQPPFNSGDWQAARKIASHCSTVFDPSLPIVTPSGSCAAMIRHGYPMLWPDRVPTKCLEIGEFLVQELGITSLHIFAPKEEPAPPDYRIAFHRACHGRALGLSTEQEQLVASLPGVKLTPFQQPEQCCGFGGAFSATHGKLSDGIGSEKLRNIQESNADLILSGDMGCLMHLQGLIDRQSLPLRTMHYLQFAAEVLEL